MSESTKRKNGSGPIARPFRELHSEELQEIIRRPPTWPVRWGITLFFVVMLFFFAGSWLIRYPDTISAPFTLVSGRAPVTVSVPLTEKLVSLLAQDGEMVGKGQVLAYTENNIRPSPMPEGKTAGPVKRNAMVAPAAGRVSLSAPWQELRQAPPGQMLLTIIPASDTIQGVVKIPQASLGKIAVGQKVLIKLEAFPYKEFGIIEGTLAHVSVSPGQDNLYWGYVDLPLKLKTIQGRALPGRNGMRGQAEIITKEKRLAERIFLKVNEL